MASKRLSSSTYIQVMRNNLMTDEDIPFLHEQICPQCNHEYLHVGLIDKKQEVKFCPHCGRRNDSN